MNEQPILSICIPTYNRAEYLGRTLQSIVNDKIFTETNLVEIIISNNCSNDDTDNLCKRFVGKYKDKIKYIKQDTEIFSEKNIFKTIEYASGKFCKLNNDTCMLKKNSLEKIINFLQNTQDGAVFFLNKECKADNVIKCFSFSDFISCTSYESTWIGGFCIKRDVYLSLNDPLKCMYSLLPQIDIYGSLFANNYSVSVIKGDYFDVQSVLKKGAKYNVAEVFGKNYFKILSNYVKTNNGIDSKVINEEKKKILPFINMYYFDSKNQFSFQKTGYLGYMFKLYFSKLYFWQSYFKIISRDFIKYIFSLSNTISDDRRTKYKVVCILGIKIKIKRVHKEKEIQNFVKTYYDCHNINNAFVAYTDKPYQRNPKDIKLLAFYLPQYHRIPINDEFHGEGFTDWKNVTSSIPHFTGHYQPQLPADCGFYDLSNPKVLEEQAKKAQAYGIYGFCYHYYWFSGDRLLEKPIFDMLNNKNISMPYCLCWANENWSKLWDGGNKEVIKKQELKEGDDKKFFNDILPFFKDERYIKINNKPLLVIYRPNLFAQDLFKTFISEIRNLAIENGFGGLYILSTNAFFSDTSFLDYVDGLVEFPPHQLHQKIPPKNMAGIYVNENFKGNIFDMEDFINNNKYFEYVDYPLFKTVFPSWDNSARKAYSNASVFELTPELYKKWLKGCIKYTKETKNVNEQFVFINAWNEWAEGAHLEADLKYGYAYLQATKEALEEENE